MTFRSKALTDLARDQPCCIRIPGICNGRTDTTVACHANWQEMGRGASHKAHDCLIVFGCHECHDAVDNRRFGLSLEVRKEFWMQGFIRTTVAIWESGKVKVVR